MRKNIVLFVLLFLIKTTLMGCALQRPKGAPATSQATSTSQAPIVVNTRTLETLEQMSKALESYVLKNNPKPFKELCKDLRFDCFIDNKPFPQKRKKIIRTAPPYGSGSKMGLQGESRVHIRYDFYP